MPAASRLWSGEPLYSNSYVYPPLSAFFASIFLVMPDLINRLVWYGINVLAFAIVLRGAWSLAAAGRAEPASQSVPNTHAIAILGLTCGIFFAFDALTNQQIDLILAALVVGGCQLLQRGRALSAALLFGLAAALKCTPLLWSGYLLWRRQWLASFLVVAGAIGFNLVPDVIVPPPQHRPRLLDWATQCLTGLATSDAGVFYSAMNFNHSIAGVAHRLVLFHPSWDGADMHIAPRESRPGPLALKGLVYGFGLALVALVLLASWRSRRKLASGGRKPPEIAVITTLGAYAPGSLEFSLVFMLMLFLSPMSSKPHFCTLFLPGFCLARLAIERRDRVIGLLLGAAIMAGLVSNKDLVGERVYDFVIWYGSVFWSCLLLFAGCCHALLVEPRASAKDLAHPLVDAARSAA